MINIKKFLLNSNLDCGTYALITYDGKTEPIWFAKYNMEDGDWFLESPCILQKITDVKEPIEDFSRNYVDGLLEDGTDVNDYIDKYVKPMIVEGILYEILNFQVAPYLPKEVDEIKLITEKECLQYMLVQKK